MIKIGEVVPDFEAEAFYNGDYEKKIKLSDYHGKWVVMILPARRIRAIVFCP